MSSKKKDNNKNKSNNKTYENINQTTSGNKRNSFHNNHRPIEAEVSL